MRLPRGTLRRSRVVSDPATVLETALDRRLTGYALFEPQDALLLDADGKGVLTFADGVPVLAYHTGTDRGSERAVADFAVPGPYRVELYELSGEALAEVHDTPELRVPPGVPADLLAGDPALAERTREAAPQSRTEAAVGGDAGGSEADDVTAAETTDASDGLGAVEAFLADEEKIEAIQEEARAEARERAEEWGLDDHVEP